MIEYEQEELYAKAEKLWGKPAQLAMLKEELAELIVAISHYERGRSDTVDVAKELADVRIMVAQTTRFLGVHGLVNIFVNDKLERLTQRILNL